MIRIQRTTTENTDFIALVEKLDEYLAEIDGAENVFYSQFNKSKFLDNVVVIYDDSLPVACGALKKSSDQLFEIKRMFTTPQSRGLGLASQVLSELEDWAKELGALACILETGKRQVEALALYSKSGYQIVPNFEPYQGVENSICFEKRL